MASNSSGNISLTNVTLANNSSGNITLTDVTLANNSSGNITNANIAVGQNSSTDALNVTEFNKNSSNATFNEAESPPCREILEIRRTAFVIMFKLSYSDNSEQWSYYHEGGKVKVCLFILHAICTRFCEPRTRLTCRLTFQIYHLLYQCGHSGNSAALIAPRHFATLGRFVSERRLCFSHKYLVMMNQFIQNLSVFQVKNIKVCLVQLYFEDEVAIGNVARLSLSRHAMLFLIVA